MTVNFELKKTEIIENFFIFNKNPFKAANIDSQTHFKIELEKFKAFVFSLNLKHHEALNETIKQKALNCNPILSEKCVLDGIKAGLPLVLHSLKNYAKEVPGLKEIQNTNDFNNLIKNQFFDYLIVRIL